MEKTLVSHKQKFQIENGVRESTVWEVPSSQGEGHKDNHLLPGSAMPPPLPCSLQVIPIF